MGLKINQTNKLEDLFSKFAIEPEKKPSAKKKKVLILKKRIRIRKNNENASEVFVPGILIICIIMHSG